MDMVDQDGDGSVDYTEFMAFMEGDAELSHHANKSHAHRAAQSDHQPPGSSSFADILTKMSATKRQRFMT